jgi:hypothetical protein
MKWGVGYVYLQCLSPSDARMCGPRAAKGNIMLAVKEIGCKD